MSRVARYGRAAAAPTSNNHTLPSRTRSAGSQFPSGAPISVKTIRSGARIQPGTILNATGWKYTLLAKIGEGGYGTVFKASAEDIGTNQTYAVAIKALDGGFNADTLSDQQIKSAIEDEKRNYVTYMTHIQSINHPNLLRYYDMFADQDDLLYIVTELLDGDLNHLSISRSQDLPINLAVKLGLQMYSALEHVHARGLIHSDIKPTNILFRYGSDPSNLDDIDFVLGDWGLVCAIEMGIPISNPQNMPASCRWGFMTYHYLPLDIRVGTADLNAGKTIRDRKRLEDQDVWGMAASIYDATHQSAINGSAISYGPNTFFYNKRDAFRRQVTSGMVPDFNSLVFPMPFPHLLPYVYACILSSVFSCNYLGRPTAHDAYVLIKAYADGRFTLANNPDDLVPDNVRTNYNCVPAELAVWNYGLPKKVILNGVDVLFTARLDAQSNLLTVVVSQATPSTFAIVPKSYFSAEIHAYYSPTVSSQMVGVKCLCIGMDFTPGSFFVIPISTSQPFTTPQYLLPRPPTLPVLHPSILDPRNSWRVLQQQTLPTVLAPQQSAGVMPPQLAPPGDRVPIPRRVGRGTQPLVVDFTRI